MGIRGNSDTNHLMDNGWVDFSTISENCTIPNNVKTSGFYDEDKQEIMNCNTFNKTYDIVFATTVDSRNVTFSVSCSHRIH